MARAVPIAPADSHFSENGLSGTKACERRLEEVEANKRWQQKPSGADPVAKCQSSQDQGAREAADDHFQFHEGLNLGFQHRGEDFCFHRRLLH